MLSLPSSHQVDAVIPDSIGDAGRVRKHLGGRIPHHGQSSSRHPGIAPNVVLRLVAHVVTPAIDLNHQARDGAVEVSDVRPNRMLTPNARAAGLA